MKSGQKLILGKAYRNCLMGAAATTLMGMSGAAAQGAENGAKSLDTIIVTATKRQESVNDVGITINAIGGDDIEELNLEDPQDLQLTVPGLVVSTPQSSNLPNFVVRGVGLNDFAPNNSSPVAVHLDDVYFTYSAFLNFGLFDLERVEVLKGPQGTTFGRNTTGGAVNFFSARPTDEFAAKISAGLNNFEGFETEFMINGAIADGVAGRLSGFFKKQNDGPFTNRFYGRNDVGQIDEYWGLRGQLLFTPTDNLDILVNVHGGVDDREGAQYDSLPALLPDFSGPCPAYVDGSLQGGETNCIDVAGNAEPDTDPFTNAQGLINRSRMENIGANIRVNADLGFAELVSITAYEQLSRESFEDADGFPGIIDDLIYINDIEQFSQELRLASTTDGPFQWLLGAYYSTDEIDTPNHEFLGGDFPGILSGANSIYVQETDAWALFANMEYDITDRLTLIGGLRYTEETRSFVGGTIITQPTTVPGAPGVPFDPPIITAETDNEVSFDDVSWKAGVNFAATDDILVYANVSNGFKSGGFNGNFAFSPQVLIPFGEENLTAYEAGFKATLANNTLQFNGAAFYYDYSDIILNVGREFPSDPTDPTSTPVIVFVLTNGAEAEMWGLETDITWLPVDGLEINAGAAYLDSEITGVEPGNETLLGSELNYAPNISANWRARYTKPVTASLEGHVQLSGTYKGDHFGEVPNSPVAAIDGYHLLGASIGVADIDGRWNLTVWGKNLTDKQYVNYINDLLPLGNVLRSPGDARSYGARVTVNF